MYLTLKAFHLISMVAWMAGLFYLPRLFVYHVKAKPGSEMDETFKTMERRLLRVIMNPAMVLTFGFGVALLMQNPELMKQGWMHTKLLLVLLLAGYHGFLAGARRTFEQGRNTRSEKFYRVANEVPTVFLIGIVFLAVLKPF